MDAIPLDTLGFALAGLWLIGTVGYVVFFLVHAERKGRA